jgi:hypothetical protein
LARAAQALATAADGPERVQKRGEAEIARKAWETARSNLTSLERRIDADRARYGRLPAADAEGLSREAAKAERVADFHAAELALLRAEQSLFKAEQAVQNHADAKTRKALEDEQKHRDHARKLLKAKRQALAVSSSTYTPLGPVYPATSSGRRLALARWMIDRENPLTARVAINQIWMRHFGTPLVPTISDFGLNGKPPTHPELLDWLAVELMDTGWKMKAIHRLIVTTSAYRMQSTAAGADDPNLAIDPSNRDYWRANPRRMEAEAVRDNLLRVGGNLDLTMGGPDLAPESGMKIPRRSLYFRHAKEKRVTFLRLFDSANPLSCYRRSESVVPQQALALANSPLSYDQSRRLARALSRQHGQQSKAPRDETFVGAAFEAILGRAPSPEELAVCGKFLSDQSRQLGTRDQLTPFVAGPEPAIPPSDDPLQRARESLVHVLLNHNDFLTIR